MDQASYLKIRFCRQGRFAGITLSVPTGVARALKQGRLPDGAEALETATSTWVPVAQHPAVVPLLTAPEPEVVLLDPNRVIQSEEYAQFLSMSDRDRRAAARNSARAPVSAPARVIVAGSSAEAEDNAASAWRRHLVAVQRWAAAL